MFLCQTVRMFVCVCVCMEECVWHCQHSGKPVFCNSHIFICDGLCVFEEDSFVALADFIFEVRSPLSVLRFEISKSEKIFS